MSTADVLWQPSPRQVEQSNLADFLRWLRTSRGRSFADYTELWRWSTHELTEFWAAVWEYYELDKASGYDAVLAERTMPGTRWFPGARLNFAQRCLANDTRPALVSVAETGEPVETSWRELRDEVAAVAVALRDLPPGTPTNWSTASSRSAGTG